MKERRRKVFLISLFSFLLISGVVYLFLILTAIEDVKKRSYLVSNYTPGQRALLPIFKYLGMIENEKVSALGKSLLPEDYKKVDELMNSNNSLDSSSQSNDTNATSSTYSSNSKGSGGSSYVNSGSKASFKPTSKIEASLSGIGLGGGVVASQTQSLLSKGFSSLSGSKNITIDKKQSFQSGKVDNANTLVARLTYTKTSLGSALKSKSADGARLEWERGFSGSVKPHGKMFYKDGALELDKIKSGIVDLKFEDERGLHLPEVAPPKIESSVSPDKVKEILSNLANELAKSMINSLGNAITWGSFQNPTQTPAGVIAEGKAANNLTLADEEKIKAEIEKWKFEPDEKVVTTYFSCEMVNCEKLGISGSGFYHAYFPDGFVLTLTPEGKVVDYYYCVSSVNQEAFLANYQKYVLGVGN